LFLLSILRNSNYVKTKNKNSTKQSNLETKMRVLIGLVIKKRYEKESI